jgi:hypothetical protein
MKTERPRIEGLERWVRGALAMAVLWILAAPVMAGPPLICHAIDIGTAQSLPWSSSGWNLTGSETYDSAHVVADTLKLLAPNTAVLVRMESIRRATLYAQRKSGIAAELLAKVEARAKENPKDALAEFDYGYLVETYKQAKWLAEHTNWLKSSTGWRSEEMSEAERVDGTALVEKAIALRGGDAAMEFAAALMTKEGADAERVRHVKAALAAAKRDPLLARNLASRFPKDPV